MVVFGSGVTAALFALVAEPDPAIVVVGAVIGALIPLGWLAQRDAAVQRAFRRQLPDAIGLLASALQAGTGIERAFDRLARDTREPMRSAVTGVARQLRVGVPLDRAMERLARRYPSDDVELLRAAIGVHAAVGGQLPRMLHSLVGTMRERERVEADINVLTSQQRYSAWVLAALPLIVAVALSFISPDYVSSMFTTAFGRVALLVASVLVAAGFLSMRRMGHVDV